MSKTDSLNKYNGSGDINQRMNELFSMLDDAFDDIENGRVQSLEDAWKEIETI